MFTRKYNDWIGINVMVFVGRERYDVDNMVLGFIIAALQAIT